MANPIVVNRDTMLYTGMDAVPTTAGHRPASAREYAIPALADPHARRT
jgi:hypothetical protein